MRPCLVTEFCISGAGCVSPIDKYLRRTKAISRHCNADQIAKRMLKTNLEPLKAINVGIDNNEGSVNRVMSLETLTRVGCVSLYKCTIPPFWWAVHQLTIAEAASVSTK